MYWTVDHQRTICLSAITDVTLTIPLFILFGMGCAGITCWPNDAYGSFKAEKLPGKMTEKMAEKGLVCDIVVKSENEEALYFFQQTNPEPVE